MLKRYALLVAAMFSLAASAPATAQSDNEGPCGISYFEDLGGGLVREVYYDGYWEVKMTFTDSGGVQHTVVVDSGYSGNAGPPRVDRIDC